MILPSLCTMWMIDNSNDILCRYNFCLVYFVIIFAKLTSLSQLLDNCNYCYCWMICVLCFIYLIDHKFLFYWRRLCRSYILSYVNIFLLHSCRITCRSWHLNMATIGILRLLPSLSLGRPLCTSSSLSGMCIEILAVIWYVTWKNSTN